MLSDALRKKPDHVPVLLRMAGLAAGRREFDAAVGHLRRAIKYEPNNTEVRLELGRILFEKGDPAGAIEQTEKALDQDRRNPDALYNLGAIHANLGNSRKAEQYWNQLIASSPASESGRRAKTMLAQLGKDQKMASATHGPESVGP
ncbi:MAG: tetratricopeptide repeat protein [Acidobacteria bacterium]|nr:MAG: tetratricopeptide repeat protein [Acidobacteriota bacterium]